jgi:hypothetical protein
MHYRVESAALPRVRAFKNCDTAVAFVRSLAKTTHHEVRVVLYTGGSVFGNLVLYIFNRRPGAQNRVAPSPFGGGKFRYSVSVRGTCARAAPSPRNLLPLIFPAM